MNLIKKMEGFQSKAYKDIGGVWTIGYGTTFLSKFDRKVEEGDKITEAEAKVELKNFLDKKVMPHIETLEKLHGKIPDLLSESLQSLAYNVGPKCLSSDVLARALEHKSQNELQDWFMLYRYCAGKVVLGLISRRATEVSNWYGRIWT